MTSIEEPTDALLERAARWLVQGRLVAFPTETVYGLGGDARNDRAIAAIYGAKGRPQFNPLIIHVDTPDKLPALVTMTDVAWKAAHAFCPGPLTLVLPRAATCPVSLLASAGLPSLAVRIPSHPIATRLLALAAIPIAAPSANASGKLSPTSAAHVIESLGGNVDLVIDGGETNVGVESTVLDLTTDRPTILRHGGTPKEQLEAVLGPVIEALHDDAAPKSPGMLTSHYAPGRLVRLNVTQATPREAFLTFGDESHLTGGACHLNLSPTGDLQEAAAHLFAMLRRLDDPRYSGIAVAPIPMTGLGAAINDRLSRAAAPREA